MSWPSTVWILTNAFDPECIVPAAHVLHERVAACMITRALGCTRKGPRRSGGPSQCVWPGDQPVNFALAATGVGGVVVRWSDVDLDKGIVGIVQAAVALGGEITLGVPKTENAQRRIKIHRGTVQILRDHLAAQGEHRDTMGAGWRDHDLCFPAVDGSPRHPDSVTVAFRRLVTTTGLPTITFHGLRHSHAWWTPFTSAFSTGRPIREVEGPGSAFCSRAEPKSRSSTVFLPRRSSPTAPTT